MNAEALQLTDDMPERHSGYDAEPAQGIIEPQDLSAKCKSYIHATLRALKEYRLVDSYADTSIPVVVIWDNIRIHFCEPRTEGFK